MKESLNRGEQLSLSVIETRAIQRTAGAKRNQNSMSGQFERCVGEPLHTLRAGPSLRKEEADTTYDIGVKSTGFTINSSS